MLQEQPPAPSQLVKVRYDEHEGHTGCGLYFPSVPPESSSIVQRSGGRFTQVLEVENGPSLSFL